MIMQDCRPEEEYKVSHIEGAVRVNPDLSDMPSTLQHIESVADGRHHFVFLKLVILQHQAIWHVAIIILMHIATSSHLIFKICLSV